ncbi:hypothetical protein ACE3MQ_25210 [Paenibacillus lentus]|uniref:hypothetical protein n=1 Tax=Paenibacillus lentus TaxID=1338368 RepID=UPI003661C356
MNQEEEVLRVAFQRLIDRKESEALIQDFIDRSKRFYAGNDELLAVLDELQQQIPRG